MHINIHIGLLQTTKIGIILGFGHWFRFGPEANYKHLVYSRAPGLIYAFLCKFPVSDTLLDQGEWTLG